MEKTLELFKSGIDTNNPTICGGLSISRERNLELNEILKQASGMVNTLQIFCFLWEKAADINEYTWLVYQFGKLFSAYENSGNSRGFLTTNFAGFVHNSLS